MQLQAFCPNSRTVVKRYLAPAVSLYTELHTRRMPRCRHSSQEYNHEHCHKNISSTTMPQVEREFEFKIDFRL